MIRCTVSRGSLITVFGSDRPVSSVNHPVRVGVIGLGLMGKPMAKNLVKAGFAVTVHNRSRAAVDELVAAGARGVDSPREVGAHSDIVITMLPDAPDVEAVVLGANGVMDGAASNSGMNAEGANGGRGVLVIDMSTISPIATRRIAAAIEARGGRMLDAPVSGGDVGAQAGTLSIMVGGAPEDFARAMPVFEAMGKTITHCGPTAAGQLVKACNQIMVGLVLEACSEALILAGKAGISADVLVPVLQGGMAATRIMELRGKTMEAHVYKPGFKAAHHLKDLRIVLDTARDLGLNLPVTTQVERMFTRLVERGQGNLDNSSVMTVVEEMAAREA
jgi:2-hydroxy-3-oxopropionate reductase